MAPAISMVGQHVGEEDLSFLQDIKTEQTEKNSLQMNLSMRRNSSFAEYFEGDLSQNLLSRSHFSHKDSGVVNRITVGHSYTGDQNKIVKGGKGEGKHLTYRGEGEAKQKKLSLSEVKTL